MRLIYEGPHKRSEFYSKIRKESNKPVIALAVVLLLLIFVCIIFHQSIFSPKTDGISPIVKLEVRGGTGSAILVNNNLLLTAAHVVDGMQLNDECGVCFCNPDEENSAIIYASAELVAKGKYNPNDTTENAFIEDYALLRLVTYNAESIEDCKIRKSSSIKTSDKIKVIGYPNGVYSASDGTVNNIAGGIINNPNVFVVDAHAWPGSSGGGLLDQQEHLIGIVTAGGLKTSQATSGQTYAIKIDYVIKELYKKGFSIQ